MSLSDIKPLMMRLGLNLVSQIELQLEWAVFPVWAPLLQFDLTVEVMGKPYNHPFWLLGSFRLWFWKVHVYTCLKGVIEVTIAQVGVATYMKWQSKGQRSAGEISSFGECLFDFF